MTDMQSPATLPSDRFSLPLITRTTVDGDEYVIYDDEAGLWAIDSADWDTPTQIDDYSTWCAGTVAVGDEDLLRRILVAIRDQGDELLVPVICVGGLGSPVSLAEDDE